MHRDIKSVDSFLFVDCVTGHLPPRFAALPPPPLDESEEDSPEDSSSSEEEEDSSSDDESEEEEPLVGRGGKLSISVRGTEAGQRDAQPGKAAGTGVLHRRDEEAPRPVAGRRRHRGEEKEAEEDTGQER